MLKIDATRASAAAPGGFALLALGFRPFYLLASAFASLSVLLWIAGYAGVIPAVYRRDPVWHAHEMLYGYTIAVIVGFLFTAGRNWTGRPTPTGASLGALALLWLAGRVLVVTPFAWTAAVVNAAFPIVAGLALAVPLARSRNRRNYFFVAILLALGVVTFAVHLAHAGRIAWPARLGLQTALDLVLFVIAVMGGRVIPMFTNNGVPGVDARRLPRLEQLALGSVLALLACDLANAPGVVVAVVSACAAVAHAARWWLWQPWRTGRAALVWILHAAYAWIVVYLVLRALAALDAITAPLAIHALTIGGIGGMTLGMMTRTAKGHTGRPLVAAPVEVLMYALVMAAAVVRVFGPLAWPDAYVATVVVSGLCWSVAFGMYAVTYWPVLTRPRLDGKPG